jgi:predicted nucleotidyltransferase component of viral defense system
MGWQEINIQKYVSEVKRNMNLEISDEIISKDLLLTLILGEFQKEDIFRELVFKGGTLLSRNYLKYHRFSEDLDFVYKNSESLRKLSRNARERKIKEFIDLFVPKLKKVADILGLDFNENRSNTKYCSILHGRTVYIFRIYYETNRYIKIEINFIEKFINQPKETSIKAITDFFDSKELMFVLGLDIKNFNVLSYTINEIILEKYRALLTRDALKERDLFDLFLINNSLKVNIMENASHFRDAKKESSFFSIKEVVEKIANSSLIKRELRRTIEQKLKLLNENKFFESDERISDLAIMKYDLNGFEKFKEKIKPILIEICKKFLQVT